MSDSIENFETCFTQCVNPFCGDVGAQREVVVTGVSSWWCACGSPMQPPACVATELLTAWVDSTGLEIQDYGDCVSGYTDLSV